MLILWLLFFRIDVFLLLEGWWIWISFWVDQLVIIFECMYQFLCCWCVSLNRVELGFVVLCVDVEYDQEDCWNQDEQEVGDEFEIVGFYGCWRGLCEGIIDKRFGECLFQVLLLVVVVLVFWLFLLIVFWFFLLSLFIGGVGYVVGFVGSGVCLVVVSFELVLVSFI